VRRRRNVVREKGTTKKAPAEAAPPLPIDVAAIAGSLVHEIKNPLSTLKINTQLLIEDWRSASEARELRTVKRLELMLAELRRLEEIINSFLSFTRRYELKREDASINDVLEGLLALIKEAAERSGVRVRTSFDASVPRTQLDVGLITQAFMNLITNAQDAMSEGGELIITSRYVPPWIEVEFIDTGCGIAPSQIDRVFDLYFSTKKGGSGLGLARCRRIIEEHGGEVVVRSEVNKGSQFTVRLPAAAEAHDG
jgi:signal transduction histidine kinase